MAKFMIQGSYTAEGLKGLQKDKASGRRDAIAKAMESIGGRLDTMYYCLGQDDVIAIVDAPDVASITALCVAVGATGLVRTRTTPMLTIEETDRALAKGSSYRAPGQ